MKAYVKSNSLNPNITHMDGMIGKVCELVGEASGAGENMCWVVQQPDSQHTWWFSCADLVLENSPDFEDWVSGKLKVVTKKPKTTWEIDKESTVVIARSTLQAIQSLLKEELRNAEDYPVIAKQDAKYFASIGDKDRSKAYYKLYDKERARLLKLQKHMKDVKKALT